MNLSPRVTSIAAMLAIVVLAAALLIREGYHRGREADQLATLQEVRRTADSLRVALAVVREKVDTVKVVVRETRERVDTVVTRLELAQDDRLRDARTAQAMRRIADSLLLAVPPAELIQRGPLVRATYAYRAEADTLRAQKARVDAVLDSTRTDLIAVGRNLDRSLLTLQDAYSDLASKDDAIGRLERDVKRLQTARSCRILGIVTCPSRTQSAIGGAVIGSVVALVVSR